MKVQRSHSMRKARADGRTHRSRLEGRADGMTHCPAGSGADGQQKRKSSELTWGGREDLDIVLSNSNFIFLMFSAFFVCRICFGFVISYVNG